MCTHHVPAGLWPVVDSFPLSTANFYFMLGKQKLLQHVKHLAVETGNEIIYSVVGGVNGGGWGKWECQATYLPPSLVPNLLLNR